MLVLEVDDGDAEFVAGARWQRLAALLGEHGLQLGAARSVGSRTEWPIGQAPTAAAPARVAVHVVQTQRRRHELEDAGAAEAVVVLPLLPLWADAPPTTVTAGVPAPGAGARRGPLSFGHVARANAPDQLSTVLRAFCAAFDSDDDVRLTVFGLSGDALEPMLRAMGSEVTPRKGEPVGPARLPDVRALALDCLATQPPEVMVSVDTASGLQPWLWQGLQRGLPAVAPRVGGQRDYLGDDNAWLVDCRSSALRQADDIPLAACPDALEKALLKAAWHGGVIAPSSRPGFQQRSPSAPAGPCAVAARLATLARGPQAPDDVGAELTAWVSTWNTKCGIASHLKNQLASVDTARHLVLAPHADGLLAADGANIVRCWGVSKQSNGFDAVLGEIERRGVTSVVIHFNWGFYSHRELGGFIQALADREVVVCIDMHSTVDPGNGDTLAGLALALRRCDRVLAHGPADVDRLLKARVDANILVQPLGVLPGPELGGQAARRRLTGATPLVATFGYSFSNKGLPQFVQAVALLKQRGVRVKALMLNAEHPDPDSARTIASVRQAIASLDLADDVEFRTEYMDDDDCMRRLAQADLIVNPYQRTGESASAAVRYCMAARRPLLVTPLDIFGDMGAAVFRAGGVTAEALADAIQQVLQVVAAETEAARAVALAAADWRRAHDIVPQAARLARLATSIRRNRAILART